MILTKDHICFTPKEIEMFQDVLENGFPSPPCPHCIYAGDCDGHEYACDKFKAYKDKLMEYNKYPQYDYLAIANYLHKSIYIIEDKHLLEKFILMLLKLKQS